MGDKSPSRDQSLTGDGNASNSSEQQPSKIQKTQKTVRTRNQTKKSDNVQVQVNDDAFFEEIQSKTQTELQISIELEQSKDSSVNPVEQATSSISSNIQLSSLTPGENILLEHIIKLQTELTVLQKSIVRLEVILDERKKPASEISDFNKINDDEQQKLGLPLLSESSLIDFDAKLKKKEFFAQVVRIFKF